MSKPTLWRITCLEDDYPGLWRLWFKNQCVTDGHNPHEKNKWRMDGRTGDRDWSATRNALRKIDKDDFVVVTLPGGRIGRIGRVLEKKIEDAEWDALVPPVADDDWDKGYMGRRIRVQWEMGNAPDSPDAVVQLPEDVMPVVRGTLRRVHRPSVERFRKIIGNPANWVGMAGRFGYERALSDYIALYPHRLKPGLEPYPDQATREKVLGTRSRADVLLRDGQGRPVIVECKQDSPEPAAVGQLRRYLKRAKHLGLGKPAGILVHGGSRTVDRKVWREANGYPIEFFQYKLEVDFFPSFPGR